MSAAVRPLADTVCHCERVSYDAVEDAIGRGARSLADLQKQTRACTRCFGCRFELEHVLREHLGSDYVATASLTRPAGTGLFGRLARARARPLPRRMYMPLLNGYGGSAVTTRIIVFNAPGATPPAPVAVRLDLLAPSGERLDVLDEVLPPGGSLVVDCGTLHGASELPDGYGTVKMVVDAEALHSLRPYFQFVTPGGITTTHEKAGTAHPREIGPRPYHWLHPIGRLDDGEEAFFFCTNTQERPMEDQRLIWAPVAGTARSYDLPQVELDGSILVPFGRAFDGFDARNAPGSVRLDPAFHKVAGFMLRHHRGSDRWRVQHL